MKYKVNLGAFAGGQHPYEACECLCGHKVANVIYQVIS